MNTTFIKILFTSFLLALTTSLYAQTQKQEPKTPEEAAVEQALKLQQSLKLSDYQLFYVDSILQANFVGQYQEFEKMKTSGLQSQKSYEDVYNKWKSKTEDAFEKILDKAQFEKFLKLSGVSAKERKQRLAK